MDMVKQTGALQKQRRASFWQRVKRHRWFYIMLLPGMIYFFIYKYLPMWGILIAFQDYQPFKGFSGSQWVGFKHFETFFQDEMFWNLFRNTFVLAIYNIVFFFPMPIIIALMLNEVRKESFKRIIQTLIYVPHFVSWVVVVGISFLFFSTENGIVNQMLSSAGKEPVNFLLSAEWFRTMITSQVIWKETGWGTIIFLAALAGIDPQLYEAARMDGAGRWRQLWHITVPAIRSTIIILLILRIGTFLDTGFEQIFLMVNPLNRDVGEVFDTYVYSSGITQGKFSYSTAVGVFKSIIGLVLVMGANRLAKRFGEDGIY
ncbi:sugar ABC transporter permease [Cohnella sp. GbtcB17]|uniref:ABC transporter permease n=1 Tax=Cohnella sp. GbtcB17 TaxID=2824762 RepID=UPI0020C6CAAF|nr:sugar ABC transporter permease [Cohnella sp. GbtcB17]